MALRRRANLRQLWRPRPPHVSASEAGERCNRFTHGLPPLWRIAGYLPSLLPQLRSVQRRLAPRRLAPRDTSISSAAFMSSASVVIKIVPFNFLISTIICYLLVGAYGDRDPDQLCSSWVGRLSASAAATTTAHPHTQSDVPIHLRRASSAASSDRWRLISPPPWKLVRYR